MNLKARTYIELAVLWSLVIAGFLFMARGAQAALDPPEGDSGPMAARMMSSEGNNEVPFAVTVGSGTGVDLYSLVDGSGTFTFAVGSSMTYVYTPRAHRATELFNPNTTYALLVSTWDRFQSSDKYWMVPSAPTSTTTYKTTNHQKIYLRFDNGASSQPVRGVVKFQ